ncbi:MAG: protein translocase subunit SecDF [Bacteroidales bacterium]|nr:protein translocase subunit SecDF [Bacteroidales bacterium]
MQNKGAIRLLAILLALVSIYQLSFTWVVSNEKSKAEEYAKNNPSKTEAEYLDSIAGKGVYNFLWLKDFTYRECQEREINLGLDLKGGMNVILEVSVIDIMRSLANNNQDSVFVATMNEAIRSQKDSQDDFVTLFAKAFDKIAPPGYNLASLFINPDLPAITYNSTKQEVLDIIRIETDGAIDNSFNILRSRIDHFGVSQPNIQTLDRAGRILVELPGIKDPERVRKLLQGTANLEFWETYDNTEAFEFISAANEKVKEMQALKMDTSKTAKPELVAQDTTKSEVALLDSLEQPKDTSLALLEKLEKDTSKEAALDNNFAQFEKENPLFAVLRPSVDNKGQLLKGAAIGYAHLKDTAKVNRYLAYKQVREVLPRTLKLIWEVKPFAIAKDGPKEYLNLVAIKVTNRDGLPALGGDVVTNARAEFGQDQAVAEVTMSMNAEGAQAWARITKENIGRQVAIVLDNYVYSFPVVQVEITGGRSQITGNFSIKEAQDLANILKSGKLPAPARIIEEEIVGPSLGNEAISAGLISFVIAFIIVLLYMLFYYKSAGLVANIALITNLFFIFGVLASLGAVLTLPGLAGIVLTIGMSVDANVLIFERIREELTLGKGLKLAISDGYKNAYSAIIDANITTLLTGIVLFIFGHGPIKGFATTLIIGIITSLFAAIFITRLVFVAMLDKKRKIEFATRFTKNAFKNININFIGKRKLFYVISGILIGLSLFSLFTKGLNQGIDFVGGRTYVVKFDNTVNTVAIANALAVEFENAPEVKTYGGDNQVKISTKYLVDSNDASTDSIVESKLYQGLKPVLGENVSFDDFIKNYRQSSRKVGPTIADDIKVGAVYAILFSLIIMFIYMFIRFKNWQFGLGAFGALVHDVLIVLGLFSLLGGLVPFSLEVDQAFIAAILTVIGYSLNDTVVVFDRIREYVREHKRGSRAELYNSALNSTLSRTFSTSFSTFIVLLAIFIFGGEVIRGFIFALLIGIVVGTYSSLFIATPIVFDTIKVQDKVKEESTKQYLGGKKKDKKS